MFKIFSKPLITILKPDDIWFAAERGDVEAVKKFVAQGADVNGKKDEEKWRPLHYAARAGHLETVKELVRLGAKMNVRTSGGDTPLSAAFYDGKADKGVVDYFLDAGADINKNDKDGVTILALAALSGDETLVKHLLLRGADPNAATGYNTTLCLAASSKNFKVVEILLQAGAKVNAEPRKDSALGSAAIYGQIEIIRLLLANGADPNHRDNSNQTALMSAVMSKKLAAVQLLLEAGADVNVKSCDEMTALDRAERDKLTKITKTLRKAGAKRGSEIAESGNKNNPSTSWELYGLDEPLNGMCLGATLEPWPPAEGNAKLKVEVTQDEYGNSFPGDLEYRVVRSEKSSEPWIQVFGETDEDGEFLSSEEIVLALGENFVQFRIKSKRQKDFTQLESWPLEVQ